MTIKPCFRSDKTCKSRVYYMHVAVPRDLVGLVGKKAIWKSLGTKDKATAEKTLARELVDLHAEWDEKRRRSTLTVADAEALIWNRYMSLLEADEQFRSGLPTDYDLTQIWRSLEHEFGEFSVESFRIFDIIRNEFRDEKETRRGRLNNIMNDVAVGETRSVAKIMAGLLAEAGLEPGNTPEHRKLGQHLQRAEIEALKRLDERDRGDFTGKPSDPVVRQPTSAPVLRPKPGESILELYDKFQKEKSGTATADTWSQNRKILEIFSSFVGAKSHVTVITRKAVRDWKSALFKYPSRAAQIEAFQGMSFHEILLENVKLEKPVIGERSINKYLSALGSFSTWLLANDYIADDVMTGMYLTFDKNKRTIKPYTIGQLKTLVASPLFTGCLSNTKEHKPGVVRVRDWRYWVPLILIYSGARLGEIAQMDTVDLKLINGVWCFHIVEDGAIDKHVKTAGSERVVPVHPELIKAGLIEYHARMKAEGSAKLFPGLKPDKRGYWSGIPSQFLIDYLTHIGLKTDRTQNVHSFRHGVADAFRRAGYLDEEFGMLLGHTRATTTQKYGIERQGNLSRRVELINAIEYEGLKVA
jgi:integrase